LQLEFAKVVRIINQCTRQGNTAQLRELQWILQKDRGFETQ